MHMWWEWTNLNSLLSFLASSRSPTCSWFNLYLILRASGNKLNIFPRCEEAIPLSSLHCSTQMLPEPPTFLDTSDMKYRAPLNRLCCVTTVKRHPHSSQKTWVLGPIHKQLWSLNRAPTSPYDCFFICKTEDKKITVHLPHRVCEGQSEITGLNKMQGIVFISRSGRNTKITDFLASRKLPEYCFIWTFIPRILKSPETVPCFA